MTRWRRGLAGGVAGLALLSTCAANPPPPAPEPVVPAPAVPIARELPPVTPVPVPPVVIVQAPPPSPVQPEPAPAPAPVSEEDQQALALLADLQRYAVESGDDLKRELASANLAMNRTRSDANRIRVAMLLTLPGAGSLDDPRALSLLEPIVNKSGNSSSMKQIAVVIYAQIVERTRSVREEQKKTAAAQEKLDALRAVERSLLLERSRNAGGGSAGGGGGTGR